MAVSKKTDEQVKQELGRLKEQIEALRQLAHERGQAFSSPDDERLTRKLRGETAKSPFIYAQSWTSGTSPGSPANYTVYVQNPDPSAYFPFYVTIFFGLGNFFDDLDEAWAGRDKRWPEFSSDRTFLAANSSQSFSFNYTVPTGLPVGTYNGNSVLWRGDFHDVGVSFDRGSFDVKLL
jgi:hypothetical protein